MSNTVKSESAKKYNVNNVGSSDPIDILDFLLFHANFIGCKIDQGNESKYNATYEFKSYTNEVVPNDSQIDWCFHPINVRMAVKSINNGKSSGKNFKKVLTRHFTSLYKFSSLVEQCLESLFCFDDLDKIFSNPKYYWPGEKDVQLTCLLEKLFTLKDRKKTRFEPQTSIIEGFIMEGKTQFLKEKDLMDSEISEFYRMEIKQNKNGVEFMPQKYFKVFALLGIYFSLVDYLIEEKEEWIIDRSWISHSFFYFEHPEDEMNFLTERFYYSIMSWLHFLDRPDLIQCQELNFTFDFQIKMYQKTIIAKIPWPFYDTRSMERKIYSDKDVLQHYYQKFYIHFYNGIKQISNKKF